MTASSAIGSQWHRWDPHLHAPGTLLNDQFKGDWSAYIEAINGAAPAVKVLGVTDYFCIRTYQEVKARWIAGAFPSVGLVFPNVELRLDIKTAKKLPINLHLLFSPHDDKHEAEIARILGRLEFEYDGRVYQCRPEQLADLGRALNPAQADQDAALRLGAQQFKVSLTDLKNLFRTESWLKENCLVAVAGGSNDGTAGLQSDDSYVLTRKEIERFANIIFASTPSQREFWLGKHPAHDAASIEREFGSLKPCLHGSDSHSEPTTAAPALNRMCWVKGDLTFETLRQVVLEPERRVHIGESPPEDGGGLSSACRWRTTNAPWLGTNELPLNSGLVAIIGSRGSGKSALVEMLAHGALCPGLDLKDSSFLSKAAEYLQDEVVEVRWGDSETTSARMVDSNDDTDWLDLARFRYLSQQFVERLCSATGLATELKLEIERVVFNSLKAAERLETDSFGELLALLHEPIKERRLSLRNDIESLTNSVVTEDKMIAGRKELTEEKDRQSKALANARIDLAKLIPKNSAQLAARLASFETALGAIELRIENSKRRCRFSFTMALFAFHDGTFFPACGNCGLTWLSESPYKSGQRQQWTKTVSLAEVLRFGLI
jgi:hypothetical protein